MLRTLLGAGLLLGTLWPSSTKIHAQSADAPDHGPRFLYAPSPTSALRDARNAPVLKRRIVAITRADRPSSPLVQELLQLATAAAH